MAMMRDRDRGRYYSLQLLSTVRPGLLGYELREVVCNNVSGDVPTWITVVDGTR